VYVALVCNRSVPFEKNLLQCSGDRAVAVVGEGKLIKITVGVTVMTLVGNWYE
jgi:hypothetical protein